MTEIRAKADHVDVLFRESGNKVADAVYFGKIDDRLLEVDHAGNYVQ